MFEDSQREKYLENPINKARYEPVVKLFKAISEDFRLYVPNPYDEYDGLFYYGDNMMCAINLKYISESEYNEIVNNFTSSFKKYLTVLAQQKNYRAFIRDCKAIYYMLKREFKCLPDPNFEEIVMLCINFIHSEYLKNYFEYTYNKIKSWQEVRKLSQLRKNLDLDETVLFGVI